MTTATLRADKTAAKFREMADRLEGEIEAKRSSRRENTPKQQKEAACQRIDADHLDRVRDALLKLAEAREEGTLDSVLTITIKSKADLLKMLRTRIDTSGGYYSVRDTGEYCDQSPLAVHLRQFLDGRQTQEQIDRQAEIARQNKIRDLEAQVKFSTIPGFYPTPPDVIDTMLMHAAIDMDMLVLEPSAGKGDIADAIIRLGLPAKQLELIERNHTLTAILGAKGYNPRTMDFLGYAPDEKFARIVMNPPFENGQDIDHVRHAYDLLAEGGRLVAIMSAGTFYRSDKKATNFREWLSLIGGYSEPLPPDSFKDAFRSTGVSCHLVVIQK